MQNAFSRWIVRHGFLAKAGVIAMGILILLLAATFPFFKNVREMSGKIKEKQKESQELADKVSVLSGLDEGVLDERVKILDRALPPKKDVVLYLSTIDGLSRELNLNFGGVSLSPGEVTEASASAEPDKANLLANGLQSLDTEIEITGTKDNIYTFLRLLEESAPLMQIKDVIVSGSEEEVYALSLKLGMLYAQTDIRQIGGQITLFDEKEESYFDELQKFRTFNVLSDINIQDLTLGKNDIFEAVIPQQ